MLSCAVLCSVAELHCSPHALTQGPRPTTSATAAWPTTTRGQAGSRTSATSSPTSPPRACWRPPAAAHRSSSGTMWTPTSRRGPPLPPSRTTMTPTSTSPPPLRHLSSSPMDTEVRGRPLVTRIPDTKLAPSVLPKRARHAHHPPCGQTILLSCLNQDLRTLPPTSSSNMLPPSSTASHHLPSSTSRSSRASSEPAPPRCAAAAWPTTTLGQADSRTSATSLPTGPPRACWRPQEARARSLSDEDRRRRRNTGRRGSHEHFRPLSQYLVTVDHKLAFGC